MMASQSSQASLPARSCLPLSKFSHATSSRSSEGQIPWIHLSSQNDLFVVFDVHVAQSTVGIIEKRQHFKVLQDPNVLEDIDLQILASEAHRAALEVKSAQDPRCNPQIAVLVRKPCIAIKYPINNTTFRRFQVRFTHQEHFYETMSILTRAGVPVLEAGSIPKQTEQAIHQPMTTGFQQMSGLEPLQLPQQLESAGMHQVLSVPDAGTTIVRTQATSQTLPLANMPASYQYRPIHPSQIAPQVHPPHVSGHTSANRMSFHAVDNLRIRPNPPSISISSQPQHIASSSISTYTPRPSTAPEIVISPAEDPMPPRRELPFLRKGRQIDVDKEESNQIDPNQATKPSNLAPILLADAPETIENSSQPNAGTTKKAVSKPRKRAAPKQRRAPVSKKPKADSSRRESANTVANEQDVIPSAAELMSHSEQIDTTLDTQILCNRVEARATTRNTITGDMLAGLSKPAGPENTSKPSKTTKVRDGKKHNTRSQSQQDESAVLTSQVSLRAGNSSQKAPCIPADQPIQVSTCTPDVSVISAGKQRVVEILRSQATPEVTGATPAPAQPQPPSTAIRSSSHPLVASDLATFLSSPSFSQATSKLNDFSTLSHEKQHDLLEKFICQSLDDENFKTLCKTIEGVWSRALCLKL